MRRRFGRGRRHATSQDERATPIDAAHWMARILAAGAVEAQRLEPVQLEGVPASFAVLGLGENAAGRPLAVGFAAERAADAALAVLALGARRRLSGEAETDLFAVAADWSPANRRRLGLLAPLLPLAAVASSALSGGAVRVAPEAPEPNVLEPRQLGARLDRSGERETFARAVAALEGLAAKHGGALRAAEDRVELVVLARTTAELVVEPGALRIEVIQPERATLPLAVGDGLATALDRLEGLLRKMLNDRKLRASEPGLRAALLPVLERAAPVVARALWPLAGADGGEPIDWVGLDAAGRSVVGAARETLGLPALAEILDASAASAGVARELARRAGRAPSAVAPRLVLAAATFERAALDACAALGLEVDLFDARTRRNGEWSLEARPRQALGDAPRNEPPMARAPEPDRAPRGPRFAPPQARDAAPAEPRDPQLAATRRAAEHAPAAPPAAEAAQFARSPQGREAAAQRGEAERSVGPREGGGREAERSAREGGKASGDLQAGAAPRAESPRFEEVSLFDLDDDTPASEGAGDPGDGRHRRGRGRRRGRRGRGEGARPERPARAMETPDASGARGENATQERADSEPGDDDVDDDEPLLAGDDDDTLAPLAEDAPDLDELVAETNAADDEDEADEEEDDDADRARRERELRRRARVATPAEPPPPPRRRAAFLAHADPISLLTAVVLARDVRLVESFWVYPQAELMTFFRSVATDLRDQTPIFLVGFAPARETIQTASLYSGRLDWFDHHEWPPEDLGALRATIGADHVHVEAGAESSLASVIAGRTRRSRFSDKLVELITGRFSQHDYEGWGRWWWQRAQEIAQQRGDRRADINPLLAGRPSDLARIAASAPQPPMPPELAYVSGRDFRLVHFGGFAMVVVEVPAELDLHLCARIARERYDAQLSLATYTDRDLVVLGGDDGRTRRGLDLGGMTAHLAAKHAWIEALADDDHIARIRVRGLHGETGRLDELITEIAMGRSIIEG